MDIINDYNEDSDEEFTINKKNNRLCIISILIGFRIILLIEK